MTNELAILRATMNSSLDGILIVDHETTKVTDFNQRFLEQWSIPDSLIEEKEDDKLLKYVLGQPIPMVSSACLRSSIHIRSARV